MPKMFLGSCHLYNVQYADKIEKKSFKRILVSLVCSTGTVDVYIMPFIGYHFVLDWIQLQE